MTEPILTYKRGEGWVYTNYPTIQLKDTLVRVETRQPELGERFTYLYKPDKYWFEENGDGAIKLDILAEEYGRCNLADTEKFDQNNAKYFEDFPNNNRHFYVFVPL